MKSASIRGIAIAAPRLLALAAAAVLCAGQASARDAVIQIHTGKHWVWYAPEGIYRQHKEDIERFYDYADREFGYITGAWGLRPKVQRFILWVRPETGGGFAAGDIAEVHAVTGKASPGIGVSYDAFYNVANGIKGYWAWVLMTHETVNLLTGQIVSGGWPVDWWADHRSPFPLMTAVQTEYALVPEVAVFHARQLGGSYERMFVQLKDQYGWALFRKAFSLAVHDGINWDLIGQNPSALRTNYVCAYLQMGAPENLAPILSPVLADYDPSVVSAIIRARGKLFGGHRPGRPFEALRRAYLHGNYKAALSAQ